MPEFKDLPDDFSCPYRDGCPYLEGLSTGWVFHQYQHTQPTECHYEYQLEEINKQLRQEQRHGKELQLENQQLRAQLHALQLEAVSELHQHIQEDIVLEPRTVVTCFRHQMAHCPKCDKDVWRCGPGEMPGAYIGPAAKATAAYLRYQLNVSDRKISQFFSDFFGLNFVPASAYGFERQAVRRGLRSTRTCCKRFARCLSRTATRPPGGMTASPTGRGMPAMTIWPSTTSTRTARPKPPERYLASASTGLW